MARIWKEMETRDRRDHSLPTSKDDIALYLDCLGRDCFGFRVLSLPPREFVLAFGDTYWGALQYDYNSDRQLSEVQIVEEAGR